MASLNTSIICFLLYTETKKILFKIGRTDLVVFTFGNTGAIRRELHWVGRPPPPPNNSRKSFNGRHCWAYGKNNFARTD
jgi:hypothetical protein